MSSGPVVQATLALPPLSPELLNTQDLVSGPVSLQNVRKGPLLSTASGIAGVQPHKKSPSPRNEWGLGEASGAQDWLHDPPSHIYVLPTFFPGECPWWSLDSILVLNSCIIQDRTNIGKSYATPNEENIPLISWPLDRKRSRRWVTERP